MRCHLSMTARGLTLPPNEPVVLRCWLSRLAEAAGLAAGDVTAEPVEDDEGPAVKIDLHSTQAIRQRLVVELLREFAPRAVDWLLLDLSGAEAEMIEAGTMTLTAP